MKNEKIKYVKFTPVNLTANDPENEDNYFSLVWSSRAGYPRITLYLVNKRGPKTNEKKPFDYATMITAPFTAITVQTFLEQFKTVIDSPEEIILGQECYNSKFENGKKIEGEIALQAKAVVGKDSDGIIYLSLIADKRRKVKIPILPNTRFHKTISKSGDIDNNKGELSMAHAKSYLKVLTLLINNEMLESGTKVDLKDKVPFKTDKSGKPTGTKDIVLDENIDDIIF